MVLVHRIAAFAFAFAMAITRCQWRHRCVVTLGELLCVLYRHHCGERKNESKGRKAMRVMSKSLHGDAANRVSHHSDDAIKSGKSLALQEICVVHRSDLRCSDVVH